MRKLVQISKSHKSYSVVCLLSVIAGRRGMVDQTLPESRPPPPKTPLSVISRPRRMTARSVRFTKTMSPDWCCVSIRTVLTRLIQSSGMKKWRTAFGRIFDSDGVDDDDDDDDVVFESVLGLDLMMSAEQIQLSASKKIARSFVTPTIVSTLWPRLEKSRTGCIIAPDSSGNESPDFGIKSRISQRW